MRAADLSQALAKLGEDCILKLAPDVVELMVGNDVVALTSMETNKLFTNVSMRSRNENRIGLLINSANLAQALKSGEHASGVVMKLSKRTGSACLTFQITCDPTVSVTHDVPVRVMRPEEVEAVAHPTLPAPPIRLFMPDLKRVRTIVERMRRIGDRIGLSTSRDGSLQVSTEGDLVTVATTFQDMKLDRDQGEDPRSQPAEPSSVRVVTDAKHLSAATHFHLARPQLVLCCPVPGSMLVLHAVLREQLGNTTLYIPTRMLPSD